jgi:hypothetical protein
MPEELLALFERYNATARLLPDDLDTEGDVATARVVLKELAAIQARIDAFIGAAA